MRFQDSKFLEVIGSLTQSINAYGFRVPEPPPMASEILPHVPDEVKKQICDSLDGYRRLIDPRQWQAAAGNRRELDLAHFEMFAKVACVSLADPEFMSEFAEGDIIEAYSVSHHQLFRSLEFFRLCSYDLLTLTMVPWHQLFRRPESVQLGLMNWAEYVLMKAIPSTPSLVPPHVIQECYEGNSRSFLYSIKRGGVLLDSVSKKPKGYLTIIRVQEVHDYVGVGLVN